MKKYTNKLMLQGFEWYIPYDHEHWNRLAKQAEELAEYGFNIIWLPPAYKAIEEKDNINRVGYGVYDKYDLGEFDQQGDIPTKYGTKEQYLKCIDTLHDAGLKVLCDIVVNHVLSGDYEEDIIADSMQYTDHNELIKKDVPLKLKTGFSFSGRTERHDPWDGYDKSDFNGYVQDHYDKNGNIITEEYDSNGNITNGHKDIYRFQGKEWSPYVSKERGNFDCLMGYNLDSDNPNTKEKIKKWAKWYMDTTKADGIRLDALKHISYDFIYEMVAVMRRNKGSKFFAVGEVWSGDLNVLMKYLNDVNGQFSLFDVALHFNLHNLATGKITDLRNILHGTLLENIPNRAVTFVDNHDTQPYQMLASPIPAEWKERAYALILFQKQAVPCVFYGDLYGSAATPEHFKAVKNLKKMCLVRQEFAYGDQINYFDDPDVIGYTRTGLDSEDRSGLAVLISKKDIETTKKMYVHRRYANETFVNVLNPFEKQKIDSDGIGEFKVVAGTTSIWIWEKAYDFLKRNRKCFQDD